MFMDLTTPQKFPSLCLTGVQGRAFSYENKPASGPPVEGSPVENLDPQCPLVLTQE